MGRLSTALLAGVALVVTGGAVFAHHSFAMFDTDHPMELQGTVTEFKFTSPHTFILLEVKGTDGSSTTWNLEGASPSALVREGWASKTLKAGDRAQDDHRSAAQRRAGRLLVGEEDQLLQRTADRHALVLRPNSRSGRGHARPKPDRRDHAGGGARASERRRLRSFAAIRHSE